MPRNQKAFFRFSVFVLIFIGLMLGVYIVHQVRSIYQGRPFADDSRETVYKSYPGFGIRVPQGYEVHGIDVSRYQKRVNWRLARSMKSGDINLQFAFIKATEGDDMVDEQFDRNWRNSKQSGFVRGAYHFYRQQNSGHDQALHFIKQVKLLPGDLPPVLDVEVYTGDSPDEFLDGIETWLELVEWKFKCKPILYTNANFYKRHLQKRFAQYPVWIAHYGAVDRPAVADWKFWQHSESGRVNGIPGLVDFNVFRGSRAEFDSLRLP